MNEIHPGAPFWSAFTAFCANEVTLFALDKLNALNVKHFWLATIGSIFVAGAVYGRAKLAEIQGRKVEVEESGK